MDLFPVVYPLPQVVVLVSHFENPTDRLDMLEVALLVRAPAAGQPAVPMAPPDARAPQLELRSE